uniref:Uncharacterized protein n=1 Tax=Timema poppense TaxID=170557 RepID=A0A7R9DK49_TIMPO|nr:unnamed protein product [Timema poppensis]
MVEQFYRTRAGDKFFYENGDHHHSFTHVVYGYNVDKLTVQIKLTVSMNAQKKLTFMLRDPCHVKFQYEVMWVYRRGVRKKAMK